MTDPMPTWTTGRWLCALCRAWGDGGADGLDDHHQRMHKEGEGS